MKGAKPDIGRREGPWAVGSAVLLVVCGGVLAAALATDPGWARPNAVQLATSYLATVAAWWAHRQVREQVTLAMAAGSTLWLAADVLALALATWGVVDRWSFTFEYVYLGGQLLFASSAFLALGPLVRFTSARRVVDGALLGVVGLFTLFAVASDAPAGRQGAVHPTLVLLVDGLFLVLAAVVCTNERRRFRWAALLIALSALVLFLTDLAFLYDQTMRVPADRWLLDAGWSVSSLVRAAGLVLVGVVAPGGHEADEVEIGHSRFLLPIVVGITAVVTAIVRRRSGRPPPSRPWSSRSCWSRPERCWCRWSSGRW